jgi:hypothetical protein
VRLLAIAVIAIGCKKAAPVEVAPGSGSGSAVAPIAPDAAVAIATPTWTLETKLIELPCGDRKLALPAPGPTTKPAERPLERVPAMTACQDQPTIAAACTCLAASADKWTSGISMPAECEMQKEIDPHAQLVTVTSNPVEGSSKEGGRAFVLIARHGDKWSAVDEVESVADIDLSETPKMSGVASITSFETRTLADGTLYAIQSQTETHEHSMGDMDYDGSAQLTVCVSPNNPKLQPFCYKPLSLGSWSYSWTTTKKEAADACAVRSVAAFSVTLDATSTTVRLAHGVDREGTAGRYHL